MRKQWMTILASLFLAFTLTTVTPAQSGSCKLEQDGGSKCGDPPPIRSATKQEAASSYYASMPSIFWAAMSMTWVPQAHNQKIKAEELLVNGNICGYWSIPPFVFSTFYCSNPGQSRLNADLIEIKIKHCNFHLSSRQPMDEAPTV